MLETCTTNPIRDARHKGIPTCIKIGIGQVPVKLRTNRDNFHVTLNKLCRVVDKDESLLLVSKNVLG